MHRPLFLQYYRLSSSCRLVAARSLLRRRRNLLSHPANTTICIARCSADSNKGTSDGRDRHNTREGSHNSSNNSCSRSSRSKTDLKPDLDAAKHQVKHRAQETIGVKLTASVVERVAEVAERRAAKAAASKTATAIAKRSAARALAKKAAVRTAERAGAKINAHARTHTANGPIKRSVLKVFPARMAVARLGRGLLIAVPIVGAAFAAWIGRSDMRRTIEELEIARADLARAERAYKISGGVNGQEKSSTAADGPTSDLVSAGPILNTTTVKCFGVATASDSVNVVAHLIVAYGLYQGWAPDAIVSVETTSLIAAVVSTGGAVGGEYLSARRKAILLEQREEEAEDSRVRDCDHDSSGHGGGAKSR